MQLSRTPVAVSAPVASATESRSDGESTHFQEAALTSFEMVIDMAMVIVPMRRQLKRWHCSIAVLMLMFGVICLAMLVVLLAGFGTVGGDYVAIQGAYTVYVLYAITLSLSAVSTVVVIAFAGYWTVGSFGLQLYILA